MSIFTKQYMLALEWEKPTDTFTYTVISPIPNISSIVSKMHSYLSIHLTIHSPFHPLSYPTKEYIAACKDR